MNVGGYVVCCFISMVAIQSSSMLTFDSAMVAHSAYWTMISAWEELSSVTIELYAAPYLSSPNVGPPPSHSICSYSQIRFVLKAVQVERSAISLALQCLMALDYKPILLNLMGAY